jgi:hypothetical protein
MLVEECLSPLALPRLMIRKFEKRATPTLDARRIAHFLNRGIVMDCLSMGQAKTSGKGDGYLWVIAHACLIFCYVTSPLEQMHYDIGSPKRIKWLNLRYVQRGGYVKGFGG